MCDATSMYTMCIFGKVLGNMEMNDIKTFPIVSRPEIFIIRYILLIDMTK